MSEPIGYPEEHDKVHRQICDYLDILEHKEKLKKARRLLGLPRPKTNRAAPQQPTGARRRRGVSGNPARKPGRPISGET